MAETKRRVVNGGIDAAVLYEKVDSIQKELAALRLALDVVQNQQVAIGIIQTEQRNQGEEIQDLRNRVNSWGIANSFFAAIAGLIGFMFGPKQ